MSAQFEIHEAGNGNCMTVAELKKLIVNWPEVDEDGEPAEVWIETTPGYSSPCKLAIPLNARGESADLELSASDNV